MSTPEEQPKHTNVSGQTIKRKQNRYRLVVMNDDSFEEVATFKLSRTSVYVAVSTLFLLLTTLTVAIIVFTPLKYYIPGYGTASEKRELMQLKMRTDSLQKAMQQKDKYLQTLKQVLSGEEKIVLDTTLFEMPEVKSEMQ